MIVATNDRFIEWTYRFIDLETAKERGITWHIVRAWGRAFIDAL